MALGQDHRLGQYSFIGLAPEVSIGTHVTATSFVEFDSEAFVKNVTEQKIESINNSRAFKKRVMLDEEVNGSLEAPLQVQSDFLIYLIGQAMGGTIGVKTIAADCWGHTISTGDMTYNKISATAGTNTSSLAITVVKGGLLDAQQTNASFDAFQFNGMRVNTLSIKAEVGGLCMISAELVGKSATVTSDSLTASFSTVVPQDFTMVSVLSGDSITNVSAEQVQSFELTINNNLVSDAPARRLGTNQLSVLPPTRREVMLTMSQRWDTITAYARARDETATAIQIQIVSDVTIGAVAGNTTYSMWINLPRCFCNTPAMPEIGDMGIVQNELEYSCLYDSEKSYDIQMQVYNGTADYN